MTDLSQFTPEERAFIVSIPYRVGIWISNIDDNTGSKIDEIKERKALEAIISNLASKSNKIPFAAEVMKAVQQNKPAWSAWDNLTQEEKVLGDVQKAVALCKAKAGDKALKEYKQTIWRVGIVIAQAYGEQIDPDNEMNFGNFIQRIGLMTGGGSFDSDPENMSKAEKTSLNKLRAILKG